MSSTDSVNELSPPVKGEVTVRLTKTDALPRKLAIVPKTDRPRPRDSGEAVRSVRKAAPYWMVLPFLALFLVFFAAPLVYAIYTSFTSNLTGRLSGLSNYRAVLHLGAFWQGVERVIYFGVVEVTLMVVLALALALLIDSPYVRGRRFFSIVYFLPYAVPGVVAALMWGFLMSPRLDQLLSISRTLGITKNAFNPLQSSWILYAIMLIVTWEFAGYNMTIYLTGLTSVPSEVMEAARIDGASEWKVARHIKIPMLKRVIIFTVVLSIIGTLQLFNEPFILNQLAGIGDSYTPNMLIYSEAFSFGNIPLAAAGSVVLAVITVLGSIAFFLVVNRSEKGPRRVGGKRPRPSSVDRGSRNPNLSPEGAV
jgi:multiple sugar transport system permease protein